MVLMISKQVQKILEIKKIDCKDIKECKKEKETEE